MSMFSVRALRLPKGWPSWMTSGLLERMAAYSCGGYGLVRIPKTVAMVSAGEMG